MDFGFDDIVDSFLDIPDTVMDLPDILGDFFSSAFDNLSEFSVTGLAFGILNVAIVFLLKSWILDPFLSYMNGIEAIFWMIGTYIGCFIAGYFLGNFFENS